MMHGAPDDSNRHVGDLGNINTPETGDTVISIQDSIRMIWAEDRPNSARRQATPVRASPAESSVSSRRGVLEEAEVIRNEDPLPLLNDVGSELQNSDHTTCFGNAALALKPLEIVRNDLLLLLL
ncbi:hypothetical protein Q1695_015078 [Nippostrongylus brasiliensis]|nr:hypothetical protein Q1695_015078 [Nippostrongylus brasiliensis]